MKRLNKILNNFKIEGDITSISIAAGLGLIAGILIVPLFPNGPLSKLLVTKEVEQLDKYEAVLKDYEAELKARLIALDAVLDDANKLDYHKNTPIKPINTDLGVGGGDEPLDVIEIKPEQTSIEKLPQSNSTDLFEELNFQSNRLRKTPLGVPVQGHISSNYGRRYSPFSKRAQFHRGVDIAADWRSPIVATAEGTVIKASWKGAYGRTVIIDHGDGIETLYGHLSQIKVKPGQKICRGQQIGTIGTTGKSTGPHVHYEVRVNKKQQDPTKFISLANLLKILG